MGAVVVTADRQQSNAICCKCWWPPGCRSFIQPLSSSPECLLSAKLQNLRLKLHCQPWQLLAVQRWVRDNEGTKSSQSHPYSVFCAGANAACEGRRDCLYYEVHLPRLGVAFALLWLRSDTTDQYILQGTLWTLPPYFGINVNLSCFHYRRNTSPVLSMCWVCTSWLRVCEH